MTRVIQFSVILCLAHMLTLSHMSADERGTIQFLEPGQPNPIRDEMEASLDEITVREVNQFHSAILDQCIGQVRADVDLVLSYGGIVAIDDGDRRVRDASGNILPLRTGQRVVGSIGHPLNWTVFGDNPSALFSVWISVRMTDQTITEWDTGKRKRFVNLSFIDGDWESRDEQRPELGDRSIVEFLSLLKVKNPAAEE